MGKLWTGDVWIDDRLAAVQWNLLLTGVSSKPPTAVAGTDNLLLEIGDDILLESGDLILME
jgi:hypothetical protein